MRTLYGIGLQSLKKLHSLSLFFRFAGHLSFSLKASLCRQHPIDWHRVLELLYYSGAKLLLPCIFIGALVSASLSQTVYMILSPAYLTHKVLPISEQILTQDLLPMLLGFILCLQAALNLIHSHPERRRQDQETILLKHVVPIMIGMNLTSFLLYNYLIVVCFLSFYGMFYFTFDISSAEFLFYLTRPVILWDLLTSLLKTLCLSTLVSLTAGYYYYETAIRAMALRTAVSRILTRGAFWLITANAYTKLTF
ncbi:MAG: ABC transporter permease [Legionella sp.]|nr:ABC transporter permease [Legionella sp.]